MLKLYNKFIKRFRIYFNKVYSFLYLVLFHNQEEIINKENKKFEDLGMDMGSAIEKLNNILHTKYDRNFNRNSDSIHWLIFSALSNNKKYNKILEIGTYDGEFTNILGNLFPSSEITTVDLPKHDPLMASFYNRGSSPLFLEYMKKQKINTNLDNIRLIKSNTFFLMDQLKKNEKFDLIWVDGGHLYPDIAWDLCNAYYLLNEGGILLCDDIIMSDKKYKTNYVSTESWEVLKYIEQRISSPITFLLKRLAPTLYSRKYSRKYVAVLKKKYIKQ
tara:strand:- start:50 stop:871 length:822 start_codon:yes stop_codon:yes gene_type:complete